MFEKIQTNEMTLFLIIQAIFIKNKKFENVIKS